jgi:hypothetical protein
MVNPNVDSSLKGAPQSGIVDPRDVLFLRIVARLGSSSAMIILQTSLLVRQKKLGAEGRHCSPSASISSAMANTAASSLRSQVMAKRRRSSSHSRIRLARASCEPNCCI